MALRKLLLACLLPITCSAMGSLSGYCTQGGQKILTNAIPSTTLVQQSYPQCSVTVFYTGGPSGVVSTSGTVVTLTGGGKYFNASGQWNTQTIFINSVPYTIASVSSATSLILTASAGTQTMVPYSMAATTPAPVFSANGSVLANPFVSSLQGYWQFYSNDGQYDVKLAGGGIPAPFTWGSQTLIDPFNLPNTVSDRTVSTPSALLTLCIEAASDNQTLLMSGMWDINGTCAASIYAYAGGGICPSSGHRAILSGPFGGDLTQHICNSPAGSVQFTGSVAAFYPEWTGSTCASPDNTVPMQTFFNMLPPQAMAVFSCGYNVESGVLYMPTSMYGALLEGAPANSGYESDVPVTKGLIAISGYSGAVLNILTPGLHMEHFSVNSSGNATTGIVFQNAASGRIDKVAVYNSTGDQFQVNPYSGPTTVTTSSINSGVSSGTFTVSNAALPGETLGSTTCPNIALEYGGSNIDYLAVTGSGNTMTITGGTTAHTHSSGALIQCAGSNNDLQLLSIQGISGGGWGLDIVEGQNNNGIVVSNPFMFGNALGGSLLSGSAGKHSGGHYEHNSGGPAVQLGDLNGGNGIKGRATAGWEVGQLTDNEGNGFDGVDSVCDDVSTVRFAVVANIEAAAANGAGPFCPFAPSGVSTLGSGLSSQSGSGTTQMTVWTALGTCTIQPGAGGGYKCFDSTGTQIATPAYISTVTTTGKNSLYQAPNYQAIETGSNNALAITLTDTLGNVMAQDISTDGTPITVKLSHTITAGTGVTIAVNGNSPLTLANVCNPSNFTAANSFISGTTIVIQFLNTFGYFVIDSGGC